MHLVLLCSNCVRSLLCVFVRVCVCLSVCVCGHVFVYLCLCVHHD